MREDGSRRGRGRAAWFTRKSVEALKRRARIPSIGIVRGHRPPQRPMSISDLPAINASFNLVSTVFISMRLVLDPSWRLAAAYGLHDNGRDLIGFFSRRLHHLSCACGRKIVGIHRMDRRDLLPDPGFACSACLCHVASGDFDAHPGFSSPLGSPSADCALDDPNLALCSRGFTRVCVSILSRFEGLSMRSVFKWFPRVRQILHSGSSCCLIRARGCADRHTYGDDCHIQ